MSGESNRQAARWWLFNLARSHSVIAIGEARRARRLSKTARRKQLANDERDDMKTKRIFGERGSVSKHVFNKLGFALATLLAGVAASGCGASSQSDKVETSGMTLSAESFKSLATGQVLEVDLVQEGRLVVDTTRGAIDYNRVLIKLGSRNRQTLAAWIARVKADEPKLTTLGTDDFVMSISLQGQHSTDAPNDGECFTCINTPQGRHCFPEVCPV
jgi:hypothetical protein